MREDQYVDDKDDDDSRNNNSNDIRQHNNTGSTNILNRFGESCIGQPATSKKGAIMSEFFGS